MPSEISMQNAKLTTPLSQVAIENPSSTRHTPQFSGKTGEYFGIWVVNLVLTVLTLGIYSAWAKVRTERYFYGNTRLAGTAFEYLAEPLTILKGRLIAYGFVLVLGLSAKFQLFVVLIPLYLILLICYPWLIYLGLRFRARYSAWRGLRFNFVGSVKDAYINFMFLPIASLFTLNLLSPWVHMQQQQYMIAGHRFGGKSFEFQGEAGKYYIPFLIAIGVAMALGLVFVMGIVATVGIGALAGQKTGQPDSKILFFMVPLVIVFYAAMFAIPIYLRTKYTNLMWQNTHLGPHRFESTLRARDMIWLYFSNGVAIVFTLGLAVPWAIIRVVRYRCAHFALIAQGALEDFVIDAAGEQGAAGAELAHALDLDLNIGL